MENKYTEKDRKEEKRSLNPQRNQQWDDTDKKKKERQILQKYDITKKEVPEINFLDLSRYFCVPICHITVLSEIILGLTLPIPLPR